MIDEAQFLKCGDVDLARTLIRAIEATLACEFYLFEHDVHERTISAALAFYMRGGFVDRNGKLDVDPEYNKLGEDPKRVLRDGVLKNVVPDIIVHRRGDQYDSNLLVIEIKTGDRGDTEQELGKLRDMRGGLRYRYALFLRFGVRAQAGQITELAWVGN